MIPSKNGENLEVIDISKIILFLSFVRRDKKTDDNVENK